MDEHFSSLCLHHVYLYPIDQNKSHGQVQSQCGGETQPNGYRRCNLSGAITLFIHSASGFIEGECLQFSSNKAYSQ